MDERGQRPASSVHALISGSQAAERHGSTARGALQRTSGTADLARPCTIFEASGTRNGIVRDLDIDAAALKLFKHDERSQAKAGRTTRSPQAGGLQNRIRKIGSIEKWIPRRRRLRWRALCHGPTAFGNWENCGH
jgi:hypothetical protein